MSTDTTTNAAVSAETVARWVAALAKSDVAARKLARRLGLAAVRQFVESKRLDYANCVAQAFAALTSSSYAAKFNKFMLAAAGGRTIMEDAHGRLSVHVNPEAAAIVITDGKVFKRTGRRFELNPEMDDDERKLAIATGREWVRQSGEKLNFDELALKAMPNPESPAQQLLKTMANTIDKARNKRADWIGTAGGKELAEVIRLLETAFPDRFAAPNLDDII